MNYDICRAIIPAKKDICGEKATVVVEFSDGDKSAMCNECAMNIKLRAESEGFGAAVKVSGIDDKRSVQADTQTS